jgi:hypothetical protein
MLKQKDKIRPNRAINGKFGIFSFFSMFLRKYFFIVDAYYFKIFELEQSALNILSQSVEATLSFHLFWCGTTARMFGGDCWSHDRSLAHINLIGCSDEHTFCITAFIYIHILQALPATLHGD